MDERDPSRLVGRTVSRYQIEEKLGGGGMGVVYKARDLTLKRAVALKFLPLELTRDEEAKQRFIQEARAASALDHVNVGTIHEIDESEDGRLFIAMTYYAGETLKAKITRGLMRVDEALGYAVQVAQGLAKAHGAGIVHRDVKPANVMVTEEGVVKIVDFGLAKVAEQTQLTKVGTTLGTVSYMSPEQARGEVVDARTDIWALGVVLYEMLTGERPFRGDYEQAVIYSVLNTDPEPVNRARPEVPAALAQLVTKALAKNPGARYRHAGELLADLRAIQQRSKRGVSTDHRGSDTRGRRRHAYRYGGGALLLVVLALVAWLVVPTGQTPIDSIAVLPLANDTGEAEQEHVVNGMTDAIIDNLSQIDAFRRVISRTSVMKYKDAPMSLPEIGRELDVAALVEGSIKAFGERVQIDVRLLDAQTEERLWEESFTREMGDVLTLQREIALAIAQAIEVELSVQEEARLTSTQQVDPAAYEAYLLGHHYLNRLIDTEPDLMQAIAYFEQAIAVDSTYAPSYAGLAQAYSNLGHFNVLSPEASWPRMRAAAEKALTLNEESSEAHVALAEVKMRFDWDWIEAERDFIRALELSPNNANAHYRYSSYLSYVGRHGEAIEQARLAIDLDPRNTTIQLGLAWALVYARRYDEALQQAEHVLQANPDYDVAYWLLAVVYTFQGKFEEAMASLRTTMALMQEDNLGNLLSMLGHLYGRLGQPQEAQRQLGRMDSLSAEGRYISPVARSLVYVGLGEKEQALDLLEQGYETRAGWMYGIITDAWYDSLRSEPRFTALVEKLRLPAMQ